MYFELSKEQHNKYDEMIQAYDDQIMKIYKNYTGLDDFQHIEELRALKLKVLEEIEVEEFNKIEKDPETMLKEAKDHFNYIFTTTIKMISEFGLTMEDAKEEDLIDRSFKMELKLFYRWMSEYDRNNGTKYSDQLNDAIESYISTQLDADFHLIMPEMMFVTVGVNQLNQMLMTDLPEQNKRGEYYWIMPDNTTRATLSGRVTRFQLKVFDYISSFCRYAKELNVRPIFSLSNLFKAMYGEQAVMKEAQSRRLIEAINAMRRTDIRIEIKGERLKYVKGDMAKEDIKSIAQIQSFIDITYFDVNYKNGSKVTYFEVKSLPPLARLNDAFGTNQYIDHRELIYGGYYTNKATSTGDRQRKPRVNYDIYDIYSYIVMDAIRGARFTKPGDSYEISMDRLYKTTGLELPEDRLDPTKSNYQDNLRVYRKRDRDNFNLCLDEAVRKGIITGYEWYTKGSLAKSTQQKKEYRDLDYRTVIGLRLWISDPTYKKYRKSTKLLKNQSKRV